MLLSVCQVEKCDQVVAALTMEMGCDCCVCVECRCCVF